jgi:hypothetical protein
VKILPVIVLAGLCGVAGAQMRHDPLNAREVDQLRENAQEPKKRIDLLISFARERMLAIERMRGVAQPATQSATQPDAKLGGGDSDRMADLLADLAAVVDELDDNLEMYNGHSEDLRRPLRHVLEAEAEFLPKLEALNEGATPLQRRRLAAAVEDAADSVKSSSESARAMLDGQIAKKGEEKEKEKPGRREAQQRSEPQE